MDLRMETSQAVSMLQPFRHPNPGLIIMDKAEKFKQNLPEFLYDDDGQIKIGRHGDTDVTNEWHEFLTKYAHQISREVAEKAFNYGYDAQISYRSFNEFWDNWIKNQQ